MHNSVSWPFTEGAGNLGAGALKVEYDENPLSEKRPRGDVPIVDEVPTRLSALDARLAEILELHSSA
jgi:hypothetical protein